MKSIAQLMSAAFVVTLSIGFGFLVADWLEVPVVFAPLFLLPAVYVFDRFSRTKFDWLKTALYFLMVGVSIWLIQVLVPSPNGERLAFLGPCFLTFILPSLEGIYTRLRRLMFRYE